MELEKILSDIPKKIYRNRLWYKASPLVKIHFNKSTVSQFIQPFKNGEDYRNFGTGNNNLIYLSDKGIIRAILKAPTESLSKHMGEYKEALLETLVSDFRRSEKYTQECNKLTNPESIIPRKSQEFDSAKVKLSIQNFFRKERKWNKFYSAAELYPRIRALQAPTGKNHLQYASGVLDKLTKEGFLEISTKNSTKIRVYKITEYGLKIDLNES